MIISIKHKGLRKFAETGKTTGIPQQFSQRLKLILTALNTATTLQDMMDLKALRCHPLKGDRQGEYSLEVNGNWRVVFKLEEPNVFDVDLE
ncbi:type II toxin-antitoxin system RelE/ParE family toxin, partial [Klebsiella oxytoca]